MRYCEWAALFSSSSCAKLKVAVRCGFCSPVGHSLCHLARGLSSACSSGCRQLHWLFTKLVEVPFPWALNLPWMEIWEQCHLCAAVRVISWETSEVGARSTSGHLVYFFPRGLTVLWWSCQKGDVVRNINRQEIHVLRFGLIPTECTRVGPWKAGRNRRQISLHLRDLVTLFSLFGS